MFLPLHDQNNESVKITPYVSYAVMIATILIFFYQMLLQLGAPAEAAQFIFRHGLVPAPFLAGETDYVCEFKGKRPNLPQRHGPPGNGAPHPGNRHERFRVLPEADPRPEVDDKEQDPSQDQDQEQDQEQDQNQDQEQEQDPDPEQNPEQDDPGELKVEVRNSRVGLLLMPITYIFLHAGWMHILGNLWFFWIFSDNVEERLGPVVFLLFYLGSGIAGGLLHGLLQSASTMPLVGASGAISGLMGAYIILFPGNRITTYFCPVWFFIRRIDVPSWVVLGFFILFNVFALSTASLETNVAFDCHLGGFAAGIAAGFLFRLPAPHRVA